MHLYFTLIIISYLPMLASSLVGCRAWLAADHREKHAGILITGNLDTGSNLDTVCGPSSNSQAGKRVTLGTAHSGRV